MTALAEHGLVPVSEAALELAHAARATPLYRRDGTLAAFTVVDADDYEEVATYRWCLNSDGYVVRSEHVGGKRVLQGLHRQLMGLGFGDPQQVDHRDHDPLNNRRSNLRVATKSENGQNRRGGYGLSPHRGVSRRSDTGKWVAYGNVNGRRTRLGQFDTEQQAADAAAAWREQHMPFTTN